MSRGLTEEPEPNQDAEGTPTIEQMDGALRELYAFAGALSGRVEELENIIAKVISLAVADDTDEGDTATTNLRGL
jgi:hypothetical protein